MSCRSKGFPGRREQESSVPHQGTKDERSVPLLNIWVNRGTVHTGRMNDSGCCWRLPFHSLAWPRGMEWQAQDGYREDCGHPKEAADPTT